MNKPIGVPSGWEEIAAFFFNSSGYYEDNLSLILDDGMGAGVSRFFDWHIYDWRVLE